MVKNERNRQNGPTGPKWTVFCRSMNIYFHLKVILAQATTYLARAAKSIEVYEAYGKAKQLVKTWTGPQPEVPIHLRNAPTKMMKNLGYGKGYK